VVLNDLILVIVMGNAGGGGGRGGIKVVMKMGVVLGRGLPFGPGSPILHCRKVVLLI
jgi:hypothetical protein